MAVKARSERAEKCRLPQAGAGGNRFDKFGGDLLSQGVYPQVPSALSVLTSVFGMGTGVTLTLWPPKSCVNVSHLRPQGLQSKHERLFCCINQALGRLVPVG